MTRNDAMEQLMNERGWDEIGADVIVTELEENGELENITHNELQSYSEDYEDR